MKNCTQVAAGICLIGLVLLYFQQLNGPPSSQTVPVVSTFTTQHDNLASNRIETGANEGAGAGADAVRSVNRAANANSCVTCPVKSVCFFGTCFCHAGLTGPNCDQPYQVPFANENLCRELQTKKYTPRAHQPCSVPKKINYAGSDKACTLLCYYQHRAGLVNVPFQLWQEANSAELKIWENQGAAGDRDEEHGRAFNNYAVCIHAHTHAFLSTTYRSTPIPTPYVHTRCP
eukprot:m.228234 g.228234  ORF g.228234 m.228234 type:complete len:231 (-) comp22384_c0_seq5:23-715(-)